MPFFIKHETFTAATATLTVEQRRSHLEAHCHWVEQLRAAGMVISSGFLVNREGQPGGGGLLVLKAESYDQALALVQKDPMIARGLVHWTLEEWRPVAGLEIIADPSPVPGRRD
ncbi:YciI family protein [Synechococcus sp. BS55D]|uniref:YciI family protein n=1 Tax=Synechococcus sp. BS55D TaxID=2055943 RepID=UPI001039C09F|nr:YciI family protein [Synechococcus sp. BS55D]TCD56138.1 hypothetical protein CWE16_06855 [Synechococcus sp. BS55D]